MSKADPVIPMAASALPVAMPVTADDLEQGVGSSDMQPMLVGETGCFPVVEPVKPAEAPKEVAFRDVWALVLFLVNVAAICYLSFQDKGIHGADGATSSGSSQLSHADIEKLWHLCVGLVGFAAIFSGIWITIMIRCGKALIKFTIMLSVALNLVAAIASFQQGSAGGACIFLIFAMLNVCYYWCVQRRIPFAAANLDCACKSVQTHWGAITVAYFCMFLQFVWIVLWTLAVMGILNKDNNGSGANQDCGGADDDPNKCPPNIKGGLYFLLLLSFYWGQQVIKNISHTTTSGTVAAWWFMNKAQNSGATLGAFKRASTTSLGSICLGSLLVAIVKALRQMAEKAREDNRGGAAACIASCLLGCLESILEYINKWAFTYVGIYGMDFKSSGQAVWELFKKRGWTAIINDNLIENVLSLGALLCGVLTAGVGLLVVKTELITFETSQAMTVGYVVAGVAGFIIGLVGIFAAHILFSAIVVLPPARSLSPFCF